MYVSYRWLERHVDLSGISPEALADDLTLSTAEVEGLEPFAPQLAAVNVGYVRECGPHPGADKLRVCKVDLGAGDALEIVCGAPNVARGQKVAIATAGTLLPGGLEIKAAKIRGVESRGMICSVRELDMGDEHEGIWVLPDHAELGASVASALGIEDWVIEIDNHSLTHRPDLWGHRGIATEVAAIYRRPLKPMDLELPETGDDAPYPLRVESTACSRYLGLVIQGARAEPSPDWLRWLLLAVGQRPIDQIVDVSNFVMLDLGQPNHTFDASRLSAQGILVRNARAGERLTTLDGEDRELEPSDLLICSGDEPVALAGIMGGQGSKIGEDTSRLLLEVATFDPVVVRRTSARLGLRTESSARFEKKLDPTLPARTATHYARLLAQLQPQVRFPAPISDAGDWTDPAHTLAMRPERVRTALGEPVSTEEMCDILERLDFGVARAGDDLQVAVPSARATKDVTIEQDLIEEIGRIYRYANIPEQTMLGEVRPPPPDARRGLVRKIQDRLAGVARFHEAQTYTFIADSTVEKLGELSLPHVTIINPAAKDAARVRRSVLASLLTTLENNRRHRDDVRLFEIGKGYLPERSNQRGEPREVHLLSLVWATHPAVGDAAFNADRLSQLYGVLVDLIRALELAEPQWAPPATKPAWAHPTRCLGATWEGASEPGALLATLEPGLARSLGLEGQLESDVAVAELSIDALLEAPGRGLHYCPIPRFPGVKVDVAVDMPAETAAAELVAAIEEAGGGLVADAELFDIYVGQNVGPGRKSLAYHVLLQSETQTLTDADQAEFLSRFERGLELLGARLRK
jgi:phenylalanyl-tRNA synthetase beta chain